MDNMYAFVVGIGQYSSSAGVEDIPFARHDATGLATLLRDRRIGLFPELNVTLILDDESSFIMRKLEALLRSTTKTDLILIYFSCHGLKDDYNELYLLTSNSDKNLLETTSIPVNFIKKQMDRAASRRQVLILDTCFSGTAAQDLLSKAGEEILPLDQLKGQGRYLMTSTSSIQPARKDEGQDLSLFTRYLLEGIGSGSADMDGDGLISAGELYEYTQSKVIDASHGQQTPTNSIIEVEGDLYLARRKSTSNPLLVELELDPAGVIDLIRKWDIAKFEITKSDIQNKDLISRPIVTEEELKKCFMPFPIEKRICTDVLNDKNNEMWLFVSPPRTGKTSFLTFLSDSMLSRFPNKVILKIGRIPIDPDPKEFMGAINMFAGQPPINCILVFDDNIDNENCFQLLSALAVRRRRPCIWATCTLEHRDSLRLKAPSLYSKFKRVESVPGFIDTDPEFFQRFFKTKLPDVDPELATVMLKAGHITVSQLCAMYEASRLPGTIELRVPSQNDLEERIRIQFSALPRSAQLLVLLLDYARAIPYAVLELFINRGDWFYDRDLDLIIQQGFAFFEVGAFGTQGQLVKPTRRIDQNSSVELMGFEKEGFISELLNFADNSPGYVTTAALVQTLSSISWDLDENAQYRFSQIAKLTNRRDYCYHCGFHYPIILKWCPSCGSETAPDASSDENVKLAEMYSFPSIPFPIPELAKELTRPRFVWTDLEIE